MTVEDRLRATAEELSGTMRQVRPLTLPSQRPGRVSRPREPRRWRGWAVPLTAAAAVIAVAVTLAAVRDGRSASPAPSAPVGNSAATTIPRYYVQLAAYTLGSGGYQRAAIVGDGRTGKVLATVKPPAHLAFAGVIGAADDRTFVIDAISATEVTQLNHIPQGTRSWYLLRLAPGTSHLVTLTRLSIAALAYSAQVDGLAISPDAGTLAIFYQPAVRSGPPGPYTLRTFSLITGKTLRTWTAPASQAAFGAMSVAGADNEAGLTWTADGRTLAFVFPPYGWPDYERTLNVTGKGANLLADSRSVLAIPGDQHNCVSLLLSSNGRTMVCGTSVDGPGACRQQEPEFDLYSTATGQLTRVLYRYHQGTCTSAYADLVWAGVGGTAIAVIQADHYQSKQRTTIDDTVGLLTPGKFTPLRVPVPAGYGAGTGTLAF